MHNSKKEKTIILFFLLNLLNLSLTNAQSPAIAIFPLQSSCISQTEVSTLTNRLNTELTPIGKYTVVDLAKVRELLKQKGFKKAGECIITECFIQIGKILGVQYIVAGSVGLIGQTYTFRERGFEQFSNYF